MMPYRTALATPALPNRASSDLFSPARMPISRGSAQHHLQQLHSTRLPVSKWIYRLSSHQAMPPKLTVFRFSRFPACKPGWPRPRPPEGIDIRKHQIRDAHLSILGDMRLSGWKLAWSPGGSGLQGQHSSPRPPQRQHPHVQACGPCGTAGRRTPAAASPRAHGPRGCRVPARAAEGGHGVPPLGRSRGLGPRASTMVKSGLTQGRGISNSSQELVHHRAESPSAADSTPPAC